MNVVKHEDGNLRRCLRVRTLHPGVEQHHGELLAYRERTEEANFPMIRSQARGAM